MGAVTVQESVCHRMFALPESPSDGEITGLSNQADADGGEQYQRGIPQRAADTVKQREGGKLQT